MQNVQIETKEDRIIITIDTSKTLGPSRSGKSVIVATTGGNKKIDTPNGVISLGINAYKPRTF